MKQQFAFFLFFLLMTCSIQAQNVAGTVTDESGFGLPGVNVTETGTTNGTITDVDGKYMLKVAGLNGSLTFSYIGYTTQIKPISGSTEVNITLLEGLLLGEVQVVGSRSFKRSSTNSAVAIDIIDLSDIQTRNGQVEINQILQYAAPSFNASKQSGSDGADHIDPATLRGLGPDQTLVLINGKRRHQSS